MKYQIFQVRDDAENSRFIKFSSLDLVNRMGLEITREKYEEVWTGEVEETNDVNETLEHIFRQFNIGWSNYAGNCQLIVKTDHPKATKDDVRKMFLGILAAELASLADKHFILEKYSLNHYTNPEAVTLFEGRSDCTLYFSDVMRAREILNYSDVRYYLNNNNDGWPFCGFDKRYLSEILNNFADKGVDVFCFKRLGV